MILIDTREPLSTIHVSLYLDKDEPVIPMTLPAGDIVISTLRCPHVPSNVAEIFQYIPDIKYDNIELIVQDPIGKALEHIMSQSVVIERKAPADFLASIGDGRLFDQTRRLVDMAKYPVLVITGTLYQKDNKVSTGNRSTNWNWWSVQMAMFRIQAAGVILLISTERQLGEMVKYFLDWLREGPKTGRRQPVDPLLPMSPDINFLCGIPGIGPKYAKLVMDHCGSLKSAIHFLTLPDSLEKENRPKGLPLTVVENTRLLFGLDIGEYMGVHLE